MQILTNFERFPAAWRVSTGESGTARQASHFEDFLPHLSETSLILINCDVSLVYRFCAHFLKLPGSRKPIVAVDLVLRKPEGFSSGLATIGKKLMLSRVDHFINYFKESEGYRKYYGITPDRSSFVHFKPNIRYRYNPETNRDGDYILCFGKSRRDYDTFFRAAARIPYPCAILQPNLGELRKHGSRFTFSLDELPPNVTVLADDGTEQSMIRAMESAKVVALPIIKQNIQPAGISVYLNAMYLHKCVIITHGAGSSDVLTDEALFVPTEDVDTLARAMRSAWEDDRLRAATAEKAYRHAASLGGEPELHQRVLEATIQWLRSSSLWKTKLRSAS
jgi:glycosyltransferase involved in cell wall biosynthesis